MSWFSKTQLVAARNADLIHPGIKGRLLPQLNTCTRSCTSDSDCNDCWTCCHCGSVLGFSPFCKTG